MAKSPSRRVYIGTARVADLLGCSEQSIRNWTAAGMLPPPVPIGRNLRWPLDTILAFARERGIPLEMEVSHG